MYGVFGWYGGFGYCGDFDDWCGVDCGVGGVVL